MKDKFSFSATYNEVENIENLVERYLNIHPKFIY